MSRRDQIAGQLTPMPDPYTRPADAPEQQDDEREVRRFLARHYWVMASAENVGDWHAYIRVCARAQEDGTAWLDRAALADLRAALASRRPAEAEPTGDAETLRDALRLIAGRSPHCETSTTERHACRTPTSGRRRDAQYGADRWCDPCIAQAALDAGQPTPEEPA